MNDARELAQANVMDDRRRDFANHFARVGSHDRRAQDFVGSLADAEF